jgi:hypothetical protein
MVAFYFPILLVVGSLSGLTPPSSACTVHGTYQGSEDISMWRDGVAFVTSGLERKPGVVPPTTQPGMVLALNLTTTGGEGEGEFPRLSPMELRGLPANFDFRPHGMHIDNTTQRLYTVAHSPTNREESVVVWDIVPPRRGGAGGSLPALSFKYALVSPNFPYHGPQLTWFLNDVTAFDGENDLLVTQFGPWNQSGPWSSGNMPADKFLWRCSWDEADVRPDGRLLATCGHAIEEGSQGLNGITIDRATGRLWVNDLWFPQLWLIDHAPDGTLTRRGNVSLPGNIDNVERDFGSGDLTAGMFCDQPTHPVLTAPCGPGGFIYAAARVNGTDQHTAATIALELDTPTPFQVSTSLKYGRYLVLGSPWSSGLVICEAKHSTSTHTMRIN